MVAVNPVGTWLADRCNQNPLETSRFFTKDGKFWVNTDSAEYPGKKKPARETPDRLFINYLLTSAERITGKHFLYPGIDICS